MSNVSSGGNEPEIDSVRTRRPPTIAVLLLLVLAAIGALAIRQATREGSGLRDDSFVYVSAAEGIASFAGYGRWAGDGSFKPVTHFPPLYSFALALCEWTGVGFGLGARLIGGAGFAATILLAGLAVLYATRSAGFALWSAALTLASPTLMDVFSWALSESLFLPLSLLSVAAMPLYLKTGRLGHLSIAGVASGLASLARFAGAALVAPLGLVILLDRSVRWNTRLRALGLYLFLSLLPVGLFLSRNVLLTGNVGNRPPPSWNPPEANLVQQAGEIMLRWIVPAPQARPTAALLAVAPIVLVAVLVLGWRYARTRGGVGLRALSPELIEVASLHALAYLGFLLIWMALVEITIQKGFPEVGERLLSPVYLAALLAAAAAMSIAWNDGGRRRQGIMVGLALLYLGLQSSAGWRELQFLRSAGRGYSSPAWQNSPTMEYVRGLPDVPIFTNDIGAVYLLAGRYASFIPSRINPALDAPRAEYSVELVEMRRSLRQEGGAMVILGSNPWGRLGPDQLAELTEGLTLIAEYQDGLVFRYAEP